MKIIAIVAIVAFFVAAFATGCKAIYSAFGTTPEAVHTRTVQTVADYAEAAVNRKIDASANLSEEGKARLREEVAKLKAEIIARIEAIRQKTKTGDAAEK